jgi:hypothetical protein
MFRKWYLPLRASWSRIVAGSLLLVLVFLFYPWSRTPAEQMAARRGYLEGLAARIDDPILWERIVIGGLAVALLQALFLICGYYFFDLVGRTKRAPHTGHSNQKNRK